MTPPVALTLGDPAGIGGEIALKAWAALRDGGPAFFLIGDLGHMAALGRRLGLPVREIAAPAAAAAAIAEGLPVLDHPLPLPAVARPPRAGQRRGRRRDHRPRRRARPGRRGARGLHQPDRTRRC